MAGMFDAMSGAGGNTAGISANKQKYQNRSGLAPASPFSAGSNTPSPSNPTADPRRPPSGMQSQSTGRPGTGIWSGGALPQARPPMQQQQPMPMQRPGMGGMNPFQVGMGGNGFRPSITPAGGNVNPVPPMPPQSNSIYTPEMEAQLQQQDMMEMRNRQRMQQGQLGMGGIGGSGFGIRTPEWGTKPMPMGPEEQLRLRQMAEDQKRMLEGTGGGFQQQPQMMY